MSKTKKRIIIISTIVGVVVVLAVILGVIFSTQKIVVDFATQTERISAYTKEEILETSGITKGKNVLFASYEEQEELLEKTYPFAKFNIVRKFPNKVIIYVYERIPVFRIEDENGMWHIYDEELKLLEKVTPINLTENNNDMLPVLSGKEVELCLNIGTFINNPNLKIQMTALLDGMYAVGGETTPITMISDIIFEYDQDLGYENIMLVSREHGTKLLVKDASTYVKEKLAYILFVYTEDISQNVIYQDYLNKIIVVCQASYNPDLPQKQFNVILLP